MLEYDGSDFAGWQRQRPEQRTVQGAFETALRTLVGAPVQCVGAGRTDAGVHALGQVASARSPLSLEPAALHRALNALLPQDVAVRALARVSDSFHALRDPVGKTYAYRLWAGAGRSPLRERTHTRTEPLDRIDLEAIRAACAHFLGTHDFASLQAAGSRVATTVRTLRRVELRRVEEDALCLEVEGDGFLRHMVRNLVGTLLEVGVGRRPADSIPALLGARDRSRAGPTAPAHGLLLVAVHYDPAVAWEVGVRKPAAGEGLLP